MAGNRHRRPASPQTVKVLERGHIYFLYRPKIEEGSAASLADVQRLYMILGPHGKERYRLLVVGQKRLPEIDGRGRKSWGFVEKVGRRA
jgi:hypothetical protein